MLKYIFPCQSSTFFKVFHNNLISIFHIKTFIFWHLFCKSSIIIQRNWRVIRRNEFLLNTNFIIVLTKTRSTMDYPCTITISDEISCNDSEASIFVSVNEEIKKWNILNSLKFTAFLLFNNFIFLFTKIIFESDFGHNVYLVLLQVFYSHIIEVRIYCKS